MRNWREYIPFFVSAMLLCVVLYLLYPHYQYYIDPDGTAYLTIARRYAEGDFAHAINGYWSPLGCWLTALAMKAGLDAIPASVVVNSAAAIGFLYISQSFFVMSLLLKELQWMLCISLVVFLGYAVYWQSFDDLWECFLLLSALRLMLSLMFVINPFYWMLYGLLGALAYFAKAYAFPFFILNTICCAWVLTYGYPIVWKRIVVVSVCSMVLCSLPWIWALHSHYGIWTTSTAGSLNTSWYLVGHPHWKAGIDALIPPAHSDSPWYWEDPWTANGDTPHFWSSLQLAGRQVLRLGLNLWLFLRSLLELSMFAPLLYAMFVVFAWLISRKEEKFEDDFPTNSFIVGMSLMLFPAGYFMVNFESRYLWYMLPLLMVTGALHIQNMKWEIVRYVLAFVFPLTFVFVPIHRLKQMYNEGQREYEVAQQMKQLGIHGTFTGMAAQGRDAQRIERLAYFSGNPYYSIPAKTPDAGGILKDMRRYHVNYYISYGPAANYVFTDEQGRAFPELTKGRIPGLQVFSVNQ